MESEIERTLAFIEGFNAGSHSRVQPPAPRIGTGNVLADLTEARVACDSGERRRTLAVLDGMASDLERGRASAATYCDAEP